jgi:kynurenine formamidase
MSRDTDIHPGVRRLAPIVSNWGRWGDDDEIGTLNHITPEKVASASRLVRRGAVFALSIPLGADGPCGGNKLRPNPFHVMTATGVDTIQPFVFGGGARYTDDAVFLPLQSSTQWDALAHVYYGGQLYNGFSSGEVDSRGAQRDGIDKTHDRYVSRGVLLDVARAVGVDCLDPDFSITADVLEQAEQAQGVHVEPGDILLVRMGLMVAWVRSGDWGPLQGIHPGLVYETVEWLHDRQVAAIAGEAVEKVESMASGELCSPFHMLALRDMGMCIGEYWYLEDLAADCAQDQVYDMMLVACPLRVSGGVGSPLNPIAIK